MAVEPRGCRDTWCHPLAYFSFFFLFLNTILSDIFAHLFLFLHGRLGAKMSCVWLRHQLRMLMKYRPMLAIRDWTKLNDLLHSLSFKISWTTGAQTSGVCYQSELGPREARGKPSFKQWWEVSTMKHFLFRSVSFREIIRCFGLSPILSEKQEEIARLV